MGFAAQDYYLVKVWRIMDHGNFTDMPSADSPDRLWWAVDEKILYRDTGSAWHRVASFDGHAYGDVVANRPTVGVADRLFFATDELILYRDTGSAWEAIGVGGNHHSRHQDGGADEINVQGLSGELLGRQKVNFHTVEHQDGGDDEINVQGLGGELLDRQKVNFHAAQHVTGGDDIIANAIAAGNAGLMTGADKTKIDGIGSGANAVIDTNIGDNVLVRGADGTKKIQSCSTTYLHGSNELTNSAQPAFSAYLNTILYNVTGDGTPYGITGDVWTERFDQGNNFALGVFTASVDGKYLFSLIIRVVNLLVGHTFMRVDISSSNHTHFIFYGNPYVIRYSADDSLGLCGSYFADMDANDVCDIRVTISGSTKAVDLPTTDIMFMGNLVC